MFKIEGLDKLTHDLDEAQKALAEVEGEIGTVSFDPDDPVSVEGAIQKAWALVDERLGAYASNPVVGPLIEPMKEQFRESIVERAAAVRLENDQK